eukprot:Skav201000  [mRNA]  locus=scaffold991:190724:199563:+ [translate_table: standard]
MFVVVSLSVLFPQACHVRTRLRLVVLVPDTNLVSFHQGFAGMQSGARCVQCQKTITQGTAYTAQVLYRPVTVSSIRTLWQHSTPVQKRSINRAYRRAHEIGFTWFRNRLMTPMDFDLQFQLPHKPVPPAVVRTKTFQIPSHRPHRRISALVWNPGGISSARYHEFLAWITQQPSDIIILPETRWRITNQWQYHDWLCIHSAGTELASGILILIHRRIASATDLQWHAIIPGRNSLDLIACYQHSWQPGQERLQLRQRWWDTLHAYLRTCPRRNRLLLGGDFNCALTANRRHVGVDGFSRPDHSSSFMHPDHTQFSAILQAHHLCALNTWNSRDPPTFTHPHHSNRIDYLITRLDHTDTHSRHVITLTSPPFLDHDHVGHFPIICSLPRTWHPQRQQHSTLVTTGQRRACAQARRDDAGPWQTFQTDLHSTLQQHLAHEPFDIHSIHQVHQPAPDIDPDIREGLLSNSNLRIQDLTFVHGLPAGRDLLRHIIARDWTTLAVDQGACNLARTRCLLCGAYVSRMQDLNRHLKTHHRQLMDHVQAFAAQLQDVHITDHHCAYCETSFVSRHSCPVLLQIAVLHVNSIPNTIDPEGVPTALRCLHCDAEFHNAQQLHQHIQASHRLGRYEWVEARDMLDRTSPACSHCHALFTDYTGLQQHIVHGRCPQFDPNRHPDSLPLRPEWMAFLHRGNFEEYLYQDNNHCTWTTTCLLCDKAYDRGRELLAHLQCEHADVWAAARPHLHVLTETMGNRHGCLCFNPIQHNRSSHLCTPLVQLSMLLSRLPNQLVIPHDIKDSDWSMVWLSGLPTTSHGLLKQILRTRDFCRLWLDSDLQQALRLHCCLCTCTFADPAFLHLHLQEAHGHQHPGLGAQLDVLSNLLDQTLIHDHVCPLCGGVFGLPSNTADTLGPLARTHLRTQCPVIRQVAHLLLSPYGGRHGTGSGPSGPVRQGAGEPGLPSTASRKRRSGHDGQGSQTRRRRDRPGEPEAPQDEATPVPTGNTLNRYFTRLNHLTVDDLSPGQAGPGHEPPSSPRPIPDLHVTRSTWHPSLPAPGSTILAREDLHATAAAPTEMPPGLSHDARTPEQSPQNLEHGSNEQHHPEPAGTEDSAGMRRLAIPSVEPPALPNGTLQEDPTEDANGTPTLGGDGGTPHGPGGHQSIPSPPHTTTEPRCALAVAIQPEIVGSLEQDGHPQSMHTLDNHRGELQEALTITISPDRDTPDEDVPRPFDDQGERQRTGQGTAIRTMTRADLQLWLQTATFTNEGEQCFCNAACHAWLWSHSCFTSWHPSHFGDRGSTLLQEFLATEDAFDWSHSPWMAPLSRRWGLLGQRADAGEFTQMLLSFTQAEHLSQRWSKRYESEGVIVSENAIHIDLIRLRLTHLHMNPHVPATLQSLIEAWSQVDGMRQALLQAPGMCCLHVERGLTLEDMRTVKLSKPILLAQDISLPMFFAPGSLDRDWLDMQVIAMVAHLGDEAAVGHYRSALRYHGPANTPKWLLTDDNGPPRQMHYLPRWFQENVTLLWLAAPADIQLPTIADADDPLLLPTPIFRINADSFHAESDHPQTD